MAFFDIMIVAGGLLLLIAPNFTYNLGRSEKIEVPKNWAVKARIMGALFLAAGVLFMYFTWRSS